MGRLDVFTYGSLMFDAVWTRVVHAPCDSVPARLSGFRRQALRDAPYPALLSEPGASVTGRLWRAVPQADLVRLDRFEGAEYRRITVEVETPAGRQSAQVYLWLDAARLVEADWDPERFAREDLAAFLASAPADPA